MAVVAALTIVTWISVTLVTRPESEETLRRFYGQIRPGGPGWRRVLARATALGESIESGHRWFVPQGVLCMLLGSLAVYASLFATGYWFYGRTGLAVGLAVLAGVCVTALFRVWGGVAQLLREEESDDG